MAEVFDFGLQEHKIKMDGGFSNNGLFAVVGDTARRLEVQLLNSNNAIQDTTGINLRLNAEVAGKITFVDAVVKDATKGIYTVNLSNGMFLEPGNWAFQWQITKGANKISSFPFAVKIGENISEGGSQATNFYFNVEELRLKTVELENRYQAMINSTTGKDVISAPEIIAARKDKPNLNARLDSFETETTAQLAHKADKSQIGSPLTATNIAGMTDKTRVYVNTADGKWYSWNGTAWVAGGDYNSIAIGDGTVTAEKLSPDVGLYTQVYPTFIMGSLAISDGSFLSSTTAMVTDDFLPYNKEDKIILKGGSVNQLRIAYFDSSDKMTELSTWYSSHETDRAIIATSDKRVRLLLRERDPATDSGKIIDETMFSTFKNNVYLSNNQLKMLSGNKTTVGLNGAATKTITAPLEAHSIVKTTGTIISNDGLTVTDDFSTSKRTGRYLRTLPSTVVKVAFANGVATVFEYDHNFNYIGNSAVSNLIGFKLSENTHLIKITLENLTVNVPSVRITYATPANGDDWVYNDRRFTSGATNVSFVYETPVNTGRSILNPTSTDKQYTETRYFNSAILELPPNYDPNGEPVKLIVWNHGSAGFQDFNSPRIDVYTPYFEYLLAEGYAILGAFPKTTKYTGSGNIYVMPTTVTALVNAYKHVVSNYNVSKTGAFVSGKSSGGFNGVLLSYGMGLPVLATGLLAPTFNPLITPYGSHEGARYDVATDFGFVGDHTLLAHRTNGVVTPNQTAELRAYMVENAEKMIGYNPWWMGLIGEDARDMAGKAYDNTLFDYETNKNKNRIFPNPIKIWYAKDDDRADISLQIPLFSKQIQNTNGNVEVRTMPSGTGGHNSVDNHPDAIKLPSVTTRLGKTHTDVPLAYVELVNYFRRFEN